MNSLVQSMLVTCQNSAGSLTLAEEVILPPRRIEACSAPQIFRAIVDNFEHFCFGERSFDDFLADVSQQYGSIAFTACGDSASANVKGIAQFFTFLLHTTQKHGLFATALFTPCFVHQFSRTILLHLENATLSPPLYSISRLHQQADARKVTRENLKQLLAERFRFKPNELPPRASTTQPTFRKHLLDVLGGHWSALDEADDDADLLLLKRALRIFNGDLLDADNWAHFCNGCHTSKQHALNDVPSAELPFQITKWMWA